MKLQLSGAIYDNRNNVVGDYAYSFISCRYSFQINNTAHHFYTEDELIGYLKERSYHI